MAGVLPSSLLVCCVGFDAEKQTTCLLLFLDHAFGIGMGTLTKYRIRTLLWMIAFGAIMKVLLGINLVDFALVISGWMLFGRLITLDDELPGGFYNPDGRQPFPTFELAGVGFTFVGLVGLKMWLVGGQCLL